MKLEYRKSWLGTRSIAINDKVRFFVGTTDHWGFAIEYSHYDRCFTIEIVHWYFGVEVWHNE